MASRKKTAAVVAKKPVGLWRKPVKLQSRKFAGALTKAIYDATTGDWKSAAGDVDQALDAAGLTTDPGEIAWKLILRALVRAVFDLVEEAQPFPADAVLPDRESFSAGLERALGSDDLAVDRAFFERPRDLPLLPKIAPSLVEWLTAHGASPVEAASMIRRLPVYFTYALHQEWHERALEYLPLWQALDTPFAKAGQRERAWEAYAARLQRQIHEPMLGEAFGIADVFVPLRGYYEEEQELDPVRAGRRAGPHDGGKACVRHVLDVGAELEAWVATTSRDAPTLRVLAGGPGSGKSSLAKMFAARLAATGARVLYVPLHHINPEGDLEAAIEQFVRHQEILPTSPLDRATGDRRLLLLLDGLDELAMQGKAAAEVAQKFVGEVRRLVDNRNHDEVRLQVLLGGRELVVEMTRSELRKPKQVLHLLPYCVPAEEAKTYTDPGRLLEADHRDAWWRRYGAAKDKGFQGMPTDLRRPDLDEITALPLLGYLVALSHERGRLDFSTKAGLDRNTVYQDLIRAVYERTYAGQQHPALGGLRHDDFVQLLEEVGLATWHGDGRTTTVAAIQKLCARSGLDRLLDRFEEGAESGATRLLAAFYFRHRGDGDRTFEFTHKSFGEYLAARRIVRALETMREEMTTRASRPGRGWSEREALRHWAEVCGPSVMDQYIMTFLVGELRGTEKALADELQKMLARLIGHMLRHGMPMEDLGARPSYAEEARQACNAEEALLVGLHACAQRTEEISEVVWPAEVSLGAWIHRLQGQRASRVSGVALDSLTRLMLKGQLFQLLDAQCANLEGANLEGANLEGANLERANLERARLTGTNLTGANLERANLERANLGGAFLELANLGGANLMGANLDRANLAGANLMGANLTRANLTRANLTRANLVAAHLDGAYLDGANLTGANLERANLERANLTGANLERANLERANLEHANLEHANLERATAPHQSPRRPA